MTVIITIVGLGQIGTSVGLSLKPHKELILRHGYDREYGVCRRAEKMEALDKSFLNLPNSVTKADIVLLSVPMSEIRKTLEIIAPELKEGAVVMDTAPVKGVVAEWAAELLPDQRHYVGLVPVINPAYLHSTDSGQDAAKEDLFRGTPMLIAAPPTTASAAVKLSADLTRLLGATPLFAEIVEMDSLMAATHVLPQLMAAALINATVDQPGWQEGRKLAGRPFVEATNPLTQMGGPEALSNSALYGAENVTRLIDTLIASLQHIRNDIAENNLESLETRLQRATSNRERWWRQRLAADWSTEYTAPAELPTASEIFGRLIGINRSRKRDKE